MFTATYPQIVTYLLAVCPFSIAFLVFLNSSVSFVVTDIIHLDHGVGDVVGTLGFADELLALIVCPFWGVLSDRIGVRWVCVAGYLLVAIALVIFVQCKNVYPQLLLGRLLFSLGGAAVATMVTAVLPTMLSAIEDKDTIARPAPPQHADSSESLRGPAVSISSENTITPTRYRSQAASPTDLEHSKDFPKQSQPTVASSSKVAGYVGMCAGIGALLSLLIFLPLPQHFQARGYSPSAALKYSYNIVAAVAVFIALWCFLGFRGLRETHSSIETVLRRNENTLRSKIFLSIQNFSAALCLPLSNSSILLGYVGGLVARASSVAISLFIPLLVNASFRAEGLCQDANSQTHAGQVFSRVSPRNRYSNIEEAVGGLPDLKRTCAQAYILASILTGVSQLFALLCAPLFGYISARLATTTRRPLIRNLPLMFAAGSGIVGYLLLAMQFKLVLEGGGKRQHGRVMAPTWVAVCLVGISQIGAIVGSLGILSAGVLETGSRDDKEDSEEETGATNGRIRDDSDTGNGDFGTTRGENGYSPPAETTPLLGKAGPPQSNLSRLKGSIAGVYSLFGGAGILFLTKLGGYLFDTVSFGSPFIIMAAFNALLLIVCVSVASAQASKARKSSPYSN